MKQRCKNILKIHAVFTIPRYEIPICWNCPSCPPLLTMLNAFLRSLTFRALKPTSIEWRHFTYLWLKLMTKYFNFVLLLRRAFRAPPCSFTTLNFCRSTLFKVTVIGWLLNDIKWGWGRQRAYVLDLVFLRTRVGYCNASIKLIFEGFKASFDGGFGYHTDQNTLCKRWKQMGKLWMTRLKCTAHWRVQSCSKERI